MSELYAQAPLPEPVKGPEPMRPPPLPPGSEPPGPDAPDVGFPAPGVPGGEPATI